MAYLGQQTKNKGKYERMPLSGLFFSLTQRPTNLFKTTAGSTPVGFKFFPRQVAPAPAFRTKPLGMGLLAYHTRDSGQIFESKLYLALQSTVQYPLAQSDVGRVEGASVCVGLFGGFSTEVLSWLSLLPVPCVL
jgi:hypothetical protein